MWLFYVALFLLLIYALFYIYASYKLSYWKRRGVKTPPTHIIFGNLKDTFTFKKSPGEVLQDIYEYADPDDPYIGFYVFHKPMLLLRDLELIKRVMIKDFELFRNRQFGGKIGIDSVGMVNLLGINHPYWKYLRSKMAPSMAGQRFRKMFPLMKDCGTPLLEYLDNLEETEDGWKDVEVKSLCSRYTTDAIASIAFGIPTNSFDPNDLAFWETGQGIVSGFQRGCILLTMFLVPEFGRLIKPLMTKHTKYFRKVFWESMKKREESQKQRGDMVDFFLTMKNDPEQNPGFKFEGDNLLAQPVSFYVAGFEAAASAIAFALYELAQNPEYERLLYLEIKETLGDQELSMELINEMNFLDRVVNEALRLYPPLPVVDRISWVDYKFPGHDLKIEKDTTVYMSINGSNRDPRHFAEPNKFNPLRTQNDAGDEALKTSLAFGVGPRSCFGRKIGQLITKLGLVTILKNYHVQRDEKKKKNAAMNPVTVFTVAADGVRVKLKKRNN